LVRYEDLQRAPEDEIARLFTFGGLPASPRLVRRVARQTEFRRHRKHGPGKHNNKGVVGSWREYFSPEDERLFAQTAGELFVRCGYRFDDQAHAA
jgi:hypothetical protein